MKCKPIFDPRRQPMCVACFMSGSGSNVRKIIEHQMSLRKSPYEVVLIFTDNPGSNASKIAKEHGIPFVANDIKKFYDGRDIKDMSIRQDYDKKTLDLIEPFKVDAIALGGYEWIVTKPLISRYLIINVHPADRSVEENGRKKYIGLYHVPSMKAILSGEKFLHSTTHIVTEELDAGESLIISKPLKVELPKGISLNDLKKPENKELLKKIAEEHQGKLKEVGDWKIFPLTLQWIAEGRFGVDEKRNIYLDGKLIKNGYRL